MKWLCVLIFQISFTSFFSQSVEVVQQSTYKHDYFVTEMQYIEDVKDTFKLQFIATVKISGDHNNMLVSNWYNLIKAKGKSLGANLYFIKSFAENENTSEMIVKMYFTGVTYVKENKKRNDKNKIFIFNQQRGKNDTAFFYLNQKRVTIGPKKYYSIDTEPYKLYNITLTSKRSRKQNHSFPKDASSVFYILPSGKKNLNDISNAQNGINISIGKNKPIEINYDLGRFLIEIYKGG
ncbi:MAG: hypothetical protein H0W73_05155 [Bacteroidetes bacterium]|nr:hypothetical protein [Bacteroidota bacterium]